MERALQLVRTKIQCTNKCIFSTTTYYFFVYLHVQVAVLVYAHTTQHVNLATNEACKYNVVYPQRIYIHIHVHIQ